VFASKSGRPLADRNATGRGIEGEVPGARRAATGASSRS